VNMATRRAISRVALLTVCLLCAASGCGEGRSQGDDDDHAGHVIPAHKPRMFPEAVRRLRELNDKIGRGTADAKTLNVALDIANWLPEIAADSDMPEAPWNQVNAHSTALVAALQQVLSGKADDARGVAENAGSEIAKLERLLETSDPKWFSDGRKAESVTSK